MGTVPAQLKVRKALFLTERTDLEIFQTLALIYSEWGRLIFFLHVSVFIPFVIKAGGRREADRSGRPTKAQPLVCESRFANSKRQRF